MKGKWLPVLLMALSALFAAGFILCVVMTVMAVRFSEWGRVFVYGIGSIVCLEALILAIIKFRNQDKS